MTDEPKRRPILKLKNPPKVTPPSFGTKAPPPPAAPKHDWKCKPCGAGFSVAPDLDDAADVRCPACNARLGTAGEFRADPPPARLRARPVNR